MLRAARLVAGKDLRIELRSRVAVNQVLPFAVLVLLLFGFALDPDRATLGLATPGLYWAAVLFTLVLAVQRAFAVETADGAVEGLQAVGLDPAGVFLGKLAALGAELLVVELLLGVGVAVFYDAGLRPAGAVLALATVLVATVGLAAAGTVYGALAAGTRVRETLLPLLLLPVVAPVLIGATRAFESALDNPQLTADVADGWPWVGLVGVFALAYTAAGLLTFGPLLEDA